MSMIAKVEKLDRKMMEELLSGKNPRGTVSDKRANEYARRMRAGLWSWLNGDTVVIDVHGRLIDGFHRLTAAMLAGVEPECLVVRGVNGQSALTKDQGWGRKFSQLLKGQGMEYHTTIAAAIRMISEYLGSDRNFSAMVATAAKDNLEWMTIKSKLLQGLLKQAAAYANSCKAPAGTACAAFYLILFSKHCKATEFIERFISGVGLAEGNPILALRRYFDNTPKGVFLGADGRARAFAVIAKAWVAYRDGCEVRVLRFGKNESKLPEML